MRFTPVIDVLLRRSASDMLALLQTPGVASVGDIGQIAWIVLAVGALISFLKDFQSISTRRLINKVTGTGDGGGSLALLPL